MNFLAHCLIGGKVESDDAGDVGSEGGLIAGGFFGDFVKGSLPPAMPADLALGIRLHRRIDAYCNDQADVRRSCARFPDDLRRLAPIFVDIIADHLLARAWDAHHPASLPEFTDRVYVSIDSRRGWLSEDGQRFLDYARQADLLAQYREWSVIARSLASVTRRIRRPELAERVEEVSRGLLVPLSRDFDAYFPDVVAHAASWIRDGAPPRVRGVRG